MVLAPEHPLVDALTADAWPEGTAASWTGGARHARARPSPPTAGWPRARPTWSGRPRGARRPASSPAPTRPTRSTAQQIPVFIADYVLMGYGTGAIMAVPGQDERDWEFAEEFDLPIVRTVQPPEGSTGEALHRRRARPSTRPTTRSRWTGWTSPTAKSRDHRLAGGNRAAAPRTVTYKLRDWLFSRQRYWGEPFPIVYDEAGCPIPLPESMLPVELPEVDDYSPETFDPTTTSPASRSRRWPGRPTGSRSRWTWATGPRRYRRETNTMPQWAGSCWYELRYLDPTNEDAFVDPENERYWMGPQSEGDPGGVDLYVGGVEHAVLHLLYARFWHKVLYDLGHVSSREPFRRLFNQGYIQAYAYTDARGSYVARRRGRRDGDGELLLRRRAGQPRVREDGQDPEERGHARRDVRHLRRRHLPGVRDVDGSAGRVAAVGDPGRGRLAPVPAAGVAQRRRRGDGRVAGHRRAGRRDDAPAAAPHHRRVRTDMDGLRFNTAIAKLIELNNHADQVGYDRRARWPSRWC